MKKFEFKMDYDSQTLSLYVEDQLQYSWRQYSHSFSVSTVCAIMGVCGGTPKNKYKAFTEKFNITPSKFAALCKATHYKYYVAPVKEWVSKYGFTSFKKYPDEKKVGAILKVKEILEQAKRDRIENIAPLVIKTKKSPQEMKKDFGKGLWKKLTHNSASRNKLIAQRATGGHLISAMQERSSTALKLGVSDEFLALRDIPWSSLVGGAGKVKTIARFVGDYKRMQEQMGLPVSRTLKWSTAKELHDTAIRAYNERRQLTYIQDFNISTEVPREVKQDGYTLTLLTSGLQVVDEGREMHHCVGSYARDIAEGRYLVYKVEGEERATLGISISHESGAPAYQYQQCYKKCNESVSGKTKAAALTLIAAINKEGRVIKAVC